MSLRGSDPASGRVAQHRAAFIAACRAELRALKPGNVHDFADGHRMTVADFEASAKAAAVPLCRLGAPVGQRIRGAVAASWSAVGCNTNLGIILLAAPLIAAAESAAGDDLRESLASVLESLTVEDAVAAYAAIAMANPAGLGRVADQDVAERPTVTLLAAMRLAADRDRIAGQYATAYEDVFERGVVRLKAALARGFDIEWATTLAYLDFLSDFSDSHIHRKFGAQAAEEVRREAGAVRDVVMRASRPEQSRAVLLGLDAALKSRGINPGTSADLTVASLLVLELENGLIFPAR